MPIPTHLIERALNLTGKTIENVCYDYWSEGDAVIISIEKFCFYLLSPEFIDKYIDSVYPEQLYGDKDDYRSAVIGVIAEDIFLYQRKDEEFPDGNPGPLISLLEKIPGQK